MIISQTGIQGEIFNKTAILTFNLTSTSDDNAANADDGSVTVKWWDGGSAAASATVNPLDSGNFPGLYRVTQDLDDTSTFSTVLNSRTDDIVVGIHAVVDSVSQVAEAIIIPPK